MENRIAKRQYIISTALRVQGQRDCKTSRKHDTEFDTIT